MNYIISVNPGKNFKLIGKVEVSSKEDIKEKVRLGNIVKDKWKNIGLDERINWVKKIYSECKKNADQIADLITQEVGTATTECRDEIAWDWGYFDWFIANSKKILATETTHEDQTSVSELIYEPTGGAAVITPWNLPFDMFLWGVIPNLLVGNTVLYKAAEECALTGKLLEKTLNKVGLPKGVLSFVHGGPDEGEYLLNQQIDLIWFTGSSEVGKKIYKLAGEKKIKAVLEMGGSNPAVIFPDADLEKSLGPVIFKRFMFSGQTCDAIKRLIVHEKIYDKTVKLLKEKVAVIKVGEPDNKNSYMGSMVSRRQQELLISQVNDAIQKGAKAVVGGKAPEGLKGAYYLPTILVNINKNMRVWKEEVFGPVLPVVKFKTVDEAIKLANDTRYGLTAQVYTNDKKAIERFINEVTAGSIDINGVSHFKPGNPFGGRKDSGMGREHGFYGLRELCEVKVVSRNK